jgi:alpha-mannosidase
MPVAVSAARRLNLMEMPLGEAARPAVSGKAIQLKIKPYEIVTLGCKVR